MAKKVCTSSEACQPLPLADGPGQILESFVIYPAAEQGTQDESITLEVTFPTRTSSDCNVWVPVFVRANWYFDVVALAPFPGEFPYPTHFYATPLNRQYRFRIAVGT